MELMGNICTMGVYIQVHDHLCVVLNAVTYSPSPSLQLNTKSALQQRKVLEALAASPNPISANVAL